jgi:hypothetical protein
MDDGVIECFRTAFFKASRPAHLQVWVALLESLGPADTQRSSREFGCIVYNSLETERKAACPHELRGINDERTL